jgi:AcrR family transcriptional regulator
MTDRAKFRRHTSEDRREMLVDATLRCLADASVDRLSVRAIAAEAGVSVGLMNHHYASKDALVADAYQRAAADLLAGLREAVEAAPDDPRSRLDAFFTQSFSARVLDPKLLKVWTSFWILADRSSHVQAPTSATICNTGICLSGCSWTCWQMLPPRRTSAWPRSACRR